MVTANPEYIDGFLKRRYRFHRKIGRGMYGVVWHAFKSDRKPVAIKRVFNAFQNRVDAQRSYREVSLLAALDHPCITALHEVHASAEDRDLYLVLDYMSSDLATGIKANVLRPIHKEFITWQLLCALKYLHSASIVHRDISPTAVLLNSRSEIKLCDFGSARLVKPPNPDPLVPLPGGPETAIPANPVMTDYQSSRWYRAPEQMLFAKNYTTAVDLWSVGCVIAEMLLLRPLFPGTSALSQIEMIVHFCGKPVESEMTSVDCGQYLQLLEGVGRRKPADITEMLPTASLEATDLLKLLLRFPPDMRISAEAALEHPYVGHFHNPDEEPVFLGDLVLTLDDNFRFSVNTYRDHIYADHVGRADINQRLTWEREKRKTELEGEGVAKTQ